MILDSRYIAFWQTITVLVPECFPPDLAYDTHAPVFFFVEDILPVFFGHSF